MKERGVLFNSEMVLAIIKDRKRNTRRPFKTNEWSRVKTDRCDIEVADSFFVHSTPFGKPGDRLWVRETFHQCECLKIDGAAPYIYKAGYEPPRKGIGAGWVPKWTPSIHMPRAASRLTLEVLSVRVERVQDISGPDCWSEGIEYKWDCDKYGSVVECFADLWDSIYGTWDDNPWVWVCEFKRVEEATA